MEQSFPLGNGLCWAGLPLSHSLVLMNDGLIFPLPEPVPEEETPVPEDHVL